MKQNSGSSNGVITFRKVVFNSTSDSSVASGIANGSMTYSGNITTSQAVNNGVLMQSVAGVASNGSLMHSVNGSGAISCVNSNVVNVGAMLANTNNGVVTSITGSLPSFTANGISTIASNGVLQTNLANGNTIIRAQNGKMITTSNIVGAAPATNVPTMGKLCLTQQQLQKLLEQQLQQQPQLGSQPQIIRLQNPQQQLIRLQQQPQQVLRLQQPTQTQIIRIAPNNKLHQGHQLPDGRIIINQPFQITAQQLQQLQQRQQTPIAIQSLQLQPQQQQVVLPGVQLVSIASAHALLEKQQQQQSMNVTNQVVATTSQQIGGSQPQLHLQAIQPHPQIISVSQSQQLLSAISNVASIPNSVVQSNCVSVNGTAPSAPAIMPSNNVQSKESDMPSFQSPLAEVEMNVPSTNQDSELDGGKNCQLTNGAAVEAQENTQPQTSSPEIHQDDDDDDDIQEVGQVINTTSNGFLSGTEKTAELEKKEDAGGGGESDPGVIDIVINNVVCSYSVGCHINLREVATNGNNVEYRREHGMVTMKLRKPPTTASIWSSGKITCTGSTSEVEARTAARRVARALQKLGCKTRFKNFRVVNVLGTCTMPFAIKITPFSRQHRNSASYEPELHPGVTYRIPHPKATLKIFSTGSITVTAPSIANVQAAIEHVYPLVSEFSKERTAEEEARRSATSVANHAVRHRPVGFSLDEDEEEEPGVGPPSFIDEFPDSPPSFMKRKRSDLSFGNDNKLRKLGPIDLVSDDSDDSSDDMEDVDDGFS